MEFYSEKNVMATISTANSIGLEESPAFLLSASSSFGSPEMDKEQEVDLFERIEDKFLLTPTQAEKLHNEILKHMHLSYIDKDTRFTLIDSLYFDSPNFDFFRDHFNPNIKQRYKLRVRIYGPNGKWQNDSFLLELKRKQENITKKTRFKITHKQFLQLQQGAPLQWNKDLQELNPYLSEQKLLKRLEQINDLIRHYQLRPSCSVKYLRYAFEEGGFRVTMDDQLKANQLISLGDKIVDKITHEQQTWDKAQFLLNSFTENEKIILELKHNGQIPEWMQLILQKLGIEKTSFSKYCYFTASEIAKVSH